MEGKEPRPKSPSLLDDGVASRSGDANARPTAARTGNGLPPLVARRARRWSPPILLVLVACVAALLALVYLFGGRGSPPQADQLQQVGARTDASPTPSGAARPVLTGAPPDAAVILPGTPDVAVATTAGAVPAAAGTSDILALGNLFAPQPKAVRRTPARRSRSTAATGDSDVALLAALIHHVEVGSPEQRKALERIHKERASARAVDPVQVRMQACPPANTEAGLRCREKVCLGHAGETAACPAPQANDD